MATEDAKAQAAAAKSFVEAAASRWAVGDYSYAIASHGLRDDGYAFTLSFSRPLKTQPVAPRQAAIHVVATPTSDKSYDLKITVGFDRLVFTNSRFGPIAGQMIDAKLNGTA